ncbi:MAG TPA: SRPBCC family protein [Candidatus Binatia bacterium]|nr:SRPBCC family protein [Candidatus Binatia bacterium]
MKEEIELMPSHLEVTTPSEREIRVARTFDAPAELVFECHTKPEYLKKWLLGPPGWSMPTCDVDLTVGGRYRYVWRNDAGAGEFGVQGEFREIDRPQRIVHTESMDGIPGEALCTTTFEESGSNTRFTLTMLFESQEARDVALESGMTEGMSMSYDRMQDLIGKERAS